MWAVLASLLVAGCGRIAFDPRGDAMDIAGDRGGDAGAACAPFDITHPIASVNGGYAFPAMAWTGSEYLMVVPENGNWGAVSVGVDGTLGPFIDNVGPAADLLGQGTNAIAWTGSRLGMIFLSGTNIVFRDVDPVSHAVTGPITVSTTSATWISCAIAWAGDRYVVSWGDNNFNIYVRELDGSGAPLTAPRLVSSAAISSYMMVVTPARYVLAAASSAQVAQAVVVDRMGPIASTTPLDTPGSGQTEIVLRSDGSMAAASNLITTTSGKLQLLDASAVPLGPGVVYPVSFTMTSWVILQATPQGYRITTITVGGSNVHDMQRIELDPTGMLIGSPQPLGSYTSPTPGVPSALALADRSLLALPIDVNQTPYQMRLIQTCP